MIMLDARGQQRYPLCSVGNCDRSPGAFESASAAVPELSGISGYVSRHSRCGGVAFEAQGQFATVGAPHADGSG